MAVHSRYCEGRLTSRLSVSSCNENIGFDKYSNAINNNYKLINSCDPVDSDFSAAVDIDDTKSKKSNNQSIIYCIANNILNYYNKRVGNRFNPENSDKSHRKNSLQSIKSNHSSSLSHHYAVKPSSKKIDISVLKKKSKTFLKAYNKKNFSVNFYAASNSSFEIVEHLRSSSNQFDVDFLMISDLKIKKKLNQLALNKVSNLLPKEFSFKIKPFILLGDYYLDRIVKYTSCTTIDLMYALHLIKRFCGNKKLNNIFSELNSHKLLLTGMIVASKCLYDIQYSLFHWAYLGGISHLEVKLLERIFVHKLNWNLNVSKSNIIETYNEFVGNSKFNYSEDIVMRNSKSKSINTIPTCNTKCSTSFESISPINSPSEMKRLLSNENRISCENHVQTLDS